MSEPAKASSVTHARGAAQVTVMRSQLGRVRGLGSAKSGTGVWWAERLTAEHRGGGEARLGDAAGAARRQEWVARLRRAPRAWADAGPKGSDPGAAVRQHREWDARVRRSREPAGGRERSRRKAAWGRGRPEVRPAARIGAEE